LAVDCRLVFGLEFRRPERFDADARPVPFPNVPNSFGRAALSAEVVAGLIESPLCVPPVSNVVPADRNLTAYDQQHLVTYLRLLDADAEGQIDAGTFSVHDHWTSERASPFPFFDSD
jgi:hypothetical protein